MNPKDKAALVTGGGTGIGRATALALARAGADVAVNYFRSKDAAEAVAAEIVAMGRRAVAVQADVSDDAQVRRMIADTLDALGRLDILVNNAGYTDHIPMKEFDAVSDETWRRTMAVNVQGPFHCIRAAAPHMRSAGAGEIVNVSSLAGIVAGGSSLPYCASKAALNIVTRAVAKALAPAIRVNAVAPGVVKTRWVEGRTAFVRSAQMQTPMRRIAEPEEIADVIVSLIAGSDFVTGQVIPVDGGLSA